MNPSTESILTEVERIAAETVFVLPNNKNIVMAAQQCAGLSEKKVIVIPTATVPQGISAMMAVDPDETDAATIEQAMNAAASAVTTAQITYAARNSEFDGLAAIPIVTLHLIPIPSASWSIGRERNFAACSLSVQTA